MNGPLTKLAAALLALCLGAGAVLAVMLLLHDALA
jgi:hypothetical protein